MAPITGRGPQGAMPSAARALLAMALVLSAAGPLRADSDGTSWRYRDEHGRVFFTDNPESIPARYRQGATAIKPVAADRSATTATGTGATSPASDATARLDDAEKALREALPAGGPASGRSSHFPFAVVLVVTAEALVVRIAAGLTGLAIGLPGVAVACCAAAFLQQLHVPVLSSVGSFLVLFLLLWKLGRADSAETVALFLVVTALLHVTALYVLVKLPAA